MNYTLIRNATAVLELGGIRFLIDPMLDPAGTRPSISNAPNQRPNPLVELPADWERLIVAPDALVVTHLHMDHFDDTAARTLDHDLPVLCQPEDADRLQAHGFHNLLPVDRETSYRDIRITRTAGHHGTGEIGRLMGPVSGFVFEARGEPTFYVAGDTIWCTEVAEAIATHRPEVIVVNGSGARFLEGDPIVMTAADIAQVHDTAGKAVILVVHLEAINHCLETRQSYRERLPELGVPLDWFRIPENGEQISL